MRQRVRTAVPFVGSIIPILASVLVLGCGENAATGPGGEPATLVVTPDSAALHALGDSVRLAAALRDANGNEAGGATVVWASLDPAVATVSPSGWVRALENGTAEVMASAGGAADTVAVTVAQAAAVVTLNHEADTLAQGETLQLGAAVTDSNGVEITAPAVEWASTAPAVAAVDTAGLVTALRGGAAVVSATVDGVSAEAAFAVLDHLAFFSDRDGSDIWVMNVDGSGQTSVTNLPGSVAGHVWSPDGTRIAFYNEAGDADVYVMNADGSGLTNLTPPDDAGVDFLPVWSPDGTKIAFRSTRGGDVDIWVVNADGSGQPIDLTKNPGGGDEQPAWSPDGTKIAFHNASGDIWVVDADGGGQPTNLTNGLGGQDPAWSPDGTKLAFMSGRDNYDIWMMNADGSGPPTNLTNDPAHDVDPAWSPDGTKIAFTSQRGGGYDIWVMNADGTGQTNLTNAAGRDMEQVWSPDGTKLAFWTDRDGNYEVYIVNADGSGQTNLTKNPANDYDPVWRPRP
ncbi:MAG TPA: Ig-like domain-containing protein [Longimicrobiales bacterium]